MSFDDFVFVNKQKFCGLNIYTNIFVLCILFHFNFFLLEKRKLYRFSIIIIMYFLSFSIKLITNCISWDYEKLAMYHFLTPTLTVWPESHINDLHFAFFERYNILRAYKI